MRSYLNAFDPRLNPQLFHQFPGLCDVISGGHTDPSEYTNTGENCTQEKERVTKRLLWISPMMLNHGRYLRLRFFRIDNEILPICFYICLADNQAWLVEIIGLDIYNLSKANVL